MPPQEKGFDTVDANRELGFEDDCREYTSVYNILADLGITSVKLMVRPGPIRSQHYRGNMDCCTARCLLPCRVGQFVAELHRATIRFGARGM